MIAALIAEVCPLGRVADPLAGFLIGGDALIQGGVVQPASLPEQTVEGCGLRPVGAQAILVGADHLVLISLGVVVSLGCPVESGSHIPLIEQLYHNVSEVSYKQVVM